MSVQRDPLELLASDPVELSLYSLKSKLMMVITSIVRDNEWTQKDAAKIMKVSQPRVSNLMNAQLSKFSIDMLIEMVGRLGYMMDIGYDPSCVDSPIKMKLKKTAV